MMSGVSTEYSTSAAMQTSAALPHSSHGILWQLRCHQLLTRGLYVMFQQCWRPSSNAASRSVQQKPKPLFRAGLVEDIEVPAGIM